MSDTRVCIAFVSDKHDLQSQICQGDNQRDEPSLESTENGWISWQYR